MFSAHKKKIKYPPLSSRDEMEEKRAFLKKKIKAILIAAIFGKSGKW